MRNRNKIYVRILAALFGVAAMSGCLKDADLSGGANNAGEAMVRLSFSMPGTRTATRGMTAAQETAVNSVNVLVFDKNDKLSYMRIGNIEIVGSTVSFDALYRVSENAADKYRLVVLVNSQWKVNGLFGGSLIDAHVGKSYAAVMAMLEETAPVAYSDWSAEGLPMWGEFKDPVQISQGMTLPAMPVLRSIARVDVGVNPAPSYNADGSANWATLSNFSLEEVIIYKAGTKYMIAPKFADFDFVDKTVSGINLPATQTFRSVHPKYTVETANRAGGLATGRGIHISSQIYLPETDVNLDADGAYLDANHLNRTAMVVGGYYNGSSQMSYYRLDFVRQDDRTKLHDLRRNHCYQAVIKEVIGSGFDDPDDAYKSYVSEIEATITEWSGGSVGVVMDGEKVMTLSRDMVFCGNEGSVAGVASVIKTTNTGAGITVTGPFVAGSTTVAPTWLTSGMYDISTVSDAVDTQLGNVKTATITLDAAIAAYVGAADREAYFLVKSGNMEYEYRIVQSKDKWITITPFPDGNCYPMDGGLHSMQAASKMLWNVDITNGNTTDVVSDLHTRSGGRNTAGQGVYFSTIDDIDKNLKSEAHVTFTYTDRAGVCPDATITVPVVTGNTISAANDSNCYMLDPVATTTRGIYIPITRANTAIAGSIGEASPLASEFMWTDNAAGAYQNDTNRAENASVQYYVRSGKGSSGYLFVQQGKGAGNSDGNTVVAIKTKADNTIRWSWHIWTTNYAPSPVSVAIMDRNLGATANTPLITGVFNQTQFEKTLGLIYQWGRKDPTLDRLGIEDFNISMPKYYDAQGNPRSMDYDMIFERVDLIARPTTISESASYCGSDNQFSWNSAVNAKTVFDPCPSGWRVATNGTISTNWSAVQNRGRMNTTGGYFPETAYNGALLLTYLYYWYDKYGGYNYGFHTGYHVAISSYTSPIDYASSTYLYNGHVRGSIAVRCVKQ